MVGFINVNKRRGDTSAFVVNRIKKIFGEKCGHMGTLDPLASGVLPVALGRASRLFDFLVEKEKTYVARFDFSFTTPSLDLESEPCDYSDRSVKKQEIIDLLPHFLGEQMQIPPDYSAKCVDGKKAYKLARRGEKLELKPKRVFIKSIELNEQTGDNEYSFTIVCGGGTYIRSICRDIADKLGVCGVMTSLERTKSGVFDITEAHTLDEIAAASDITKFIIPPDEAVTFPKLILSDDNATRILNGLTEGYAYKDGVYRVYAFNTFWGVMRSENGKVKITYVK